MCEIPTRRRRWSNEKTDAFVPRDEETYGGCFSIRMLAKSKSIIINSADEEWMGDDDPNLALPLGPHHKTEYTKAPAFRYDSRGKLLIGDEPIRPETGSVTPESLEDYTPSVYSAESFEPLNVMDQIPQATLDLCVTQLLDELDKWDEQRGNNNQYNTSVQTSTKAWVDAVALHQDGPSGKTLTTTTPKTKRKWGIDGHMNSSQKKPQAEGAPDYKTARSRFLACPFYKLRPSTYQKCRIPCLTGISRVKEHLRKHHSIPIHCVRCYGLFETIQERDQHLREVVCETQNLKVFMGYGEAEERVIQRCVDPQEPMAVQWHKIFTMLFPCHPPPTSPYIEAELADIMVQLQSFIEHKRWDILDTLYQELPDPLRSQEGAMRGLWELLLEVTIGRLVKAPEAGMGYLVASNSNGNRQKVISDMDIMPMPSETAK